MKLNIKIFNISIHLSSSIRFIGSATAVQGTTNRTMDGKYVLYLDYDKLHYVHVMSELEFLQKKHNLSNIHIFSSSESNYHAVCFDKLTAREFTDILSESSADANFKRIPLMFTYRTWVLRFSGKGKNKKRPKYLTTIRSNEHWREQSYAHYEMFKKLYPGTRQYATELIRFDNINELEHITYETNIRK